MNLANVVTMQDLVTIVPIVFLTMASFLPLLIKVFRGNQEPNPFITLMYNFIGLIGAAFWTAALSGANKMAFNNAIVIDGTSIWMSFLVYFITAISLMLAYDNVATRGRQFTEFCFLMVSSAIGMLVLLMANDLIITFIGIEMMSLCLYILVAMSKEQILSKEASFKYFVLGSFASAIFLYGVAFVYGTAESTYLPVIASKAGLLITKNPMFLIGIALVVLGFAFKVSIFPLHAWTPDVYQGAPTPVTAFMSTAVKAVTFVAFLRLFNSDGFAQSPALFTAMSWMAVLTMFIGNAGALMQDNFKRMLAYSSVAHSGYILVGLIAAGFGTNFVGGASGVLLYVFTYSLMTLGSFALVALFEKKENTQVSVSGLKGLAKRNPWMALSLTVLMLSLAGIPPTLGFFGKFYLFTAAIDQGMYWLAFWGVINSVISVYYYLRPVVMMYMSEEEAEETIEEHGLTRMAVLVAAVLIVVLGVLSSPVITAVQRSVISTEAVSGQGQ
jgi:NADH-quinone oxidoreductase subunit N